MRGIRMRFEEQPGLCRKTRQAIPAAIAAAGSAGSRLRPAQRPRPAARRLKALNDRKRMSLKTWAGFRVSADNAMALFALQAAADAGEPRVRLNPWRDWPPRRGSSSPTPPARRRTSPAGGAGEHRLRVRSSSGGCRRGFPCRAAVSARRRACSSSLARPARALAPTVEALPLMVCRVAALPWTSPSPSWRSSWAKRSCMSGTKRRNTRTISSRLPPENARRYRPAPRPVRPRPLPLPARPGAPLLPR